MHNFDLLRDRSINLKACFGHYESCHIPQREHSIGTAAGKTIANAIPRDLISAIATISALRFFSYLAKRLLQLRVVALFVANFRVAPSAPTML